MKNLLDELMRVMARHGIEETDAAHHTGRC